MAQICISYRREDSSGHAGRLYDRLSAHFGTPAVFMDIDTIEPGTDFVNAVRGAVESCHVVLVVIGKWWLGATDENGHRRLDNPEDVVRLEIFTALKRNILIIPVLVGGARVPRESDLPQPLAGLARRHAIELSDIAFPEAVKRLIDTIEGVLANQPNSLPPMEVKPDPPLTTPATSTESSVQLASGRYLRRRDVLAAQSSRSADEHVRVCPVDGMEYVWVPGGEFFMGAAPSDELAGSCERPSYFPT